MPDEIFDIIDDDDIVIGQEVRSYVHQRGLWHRGVHVLLFTREGKLLVQQRSKDRMHSPLALDCSVSEHVKAGENYYMAAIRGLLEEMGVSGVEIQPLIKFKMKYGPNDNEISELYRGFVNPNAVKFDPVEVEGIEYYSLPELEKLVKNKDFILSYWFEQIIHWYLGNPSALEVLKNYPNPSPE
ncbi:MAG: NUDIX domain-containing protein [Anaerolineales bacterium]|uniref:NUDIX domain-containing protein n=1 Tax=Candidatus Desulfolinea nitratireducens TaxID=2841698 RepID=A0A8J6NNK7_9CHLR|nr:NUDIX domain-containing protein [Candidatus Desulfolinea nitratireducens]